MPKPKLSIIEGGSAPRRPQYNPEALVEGIKQANVNIGKLQEAIANEEKRKGEFQFYLDEHERFNKHQREQQDLRNQVARDEQAKKRKKAAKSQRAQKRKEKLGR